MVDRPLATETGLALLGLDSGDERVYRGILRSAPGATVMQLCETTGLAAGELEVHLERLVDAGLVRVSDGVVTAEPPAVAVGGVVEAQTRRLQRVATQVDALRNLVPALVADHQATGGSAHSTVAVEANQGGEVARLLRKLAEESEGEMRWFRPDQWRLPVTREIDGLVTELLESGRPSRAIYPSRVLDDAPDVVRRRAEAGELVRIVARLPTRLAVMGDQVALLPDRWGGNTGRRLVIREHSIVGALGALFEHVWDQAMAVPGLEGGAPDPAGERRLLLHELAHGAKDEQLARAMGVSLRTVRRRIADLMQELGATSRFEAGVEAVRRGWI